MKINNQYELQVESPPPLYFRDEMFAVIEGRILVIEGEHLDISRFLTRFGPPDLETYSDFAVLECKGLTFLLLPKSINMAIPSEFFMRFDLSRHPQGNNALTIIRHVFNNEVFGVVLDCKYLIKLILPNSLTTIYYHAFARCPNLAKVILPNCLMAIGDYAFANCVSLTDLSLPSTLTSIGDYAFSNCIGITSLVLPQSLRVIHEHSFIGCTNLTRILIDTNDLSEFNRIKRLLPIELRVLTVFKPIEEAQQRIVDEFCRLYPDFETHHLMDRKVKQLILGPQCEAGYYNVDVNMVYELSKHLRKDAVTLKKALEQVDMPALPVVPNQQWTVYESELKTIQRQFVVHYKINLRRYTAEYLQTYHALLNKMYLREYEGPKNYYRHLLCSLSIFSAKPSASLDRELRKNTLYRTLALIQKIIIVYTKGRPLVLCENEKKLLQKPTFLARIPGLLRKELGLETSPTHFKSALSQVPSAAGDTLFDCSPSR